MDEYIKKLIGEYVQITGDGPGLMVSLQEESEGGYRQRIVFLDGITTPGLTREIAEQYAERLRSALYDFAYDLLDIYDGCR